jgi:hypothetical protein
MTSIAVWNSSLLQGRSFSSAATASRWSSLDPASSVPFEEYWRSSPFVSLLMPRCHRARHGPIAVCFDPPLAHALGR